MRRSLALTATAALLVLPSLTACSGSGSSKTAVSSTSSSSSAATSEAAAPTSNSSSSTSDGGSTAKPSKDEVKAGLVTFYATKGVTGAPATMLAGCIVDKGYDQFSAQTLNAMKDGKPKNMDQKDSAAFVRVSGQCATAGEMPSMPSEK